MDSSLDEALAKNPDRRVPALVMFDRQAAELPAGSPAGTRARAEALSESDAKATHQLIGRRGEAFWVVNAQRIEVNQSELTQLAASSRVRSIHDASVQITMTSAPIVRGTPASIGWGQVRIGAPQAHARGLTGAGVRVGVIDSGIVPNHPLISGRVVAWGDFVNGHPAPYDDQGHGTLVSGVIAGHASIPNGTLGVAPGVDLVVAKAISSSGHGDGGMFLRAAEWMVDPDGNPATADYPTIINNSWTAPAKQHPWMKAAIQTWRAMNILPVFAAGNSGPVEGSIGSPSDYEEVLTVGATNRAGSVSGFSSRGPVMWADESDPAKVRAIMKPDLVAPGEDILTTDAGGGLSYVNGTSLAAPMVAGAAALITQMEPGITPERLMEQLFAALAPMADGVNAAGRGELRIPNSLIPSAPRGPAPTFPPGRKPLNEVTPPEMTPPTLSLARVLPRFTRAKRLNVRLALPDVPVLYRFLVNGKSRGSVQFETHATLPLPDEGIMRIGARVMDVDESALGRVALGSVIVDRTAPKLRVKLTRHGKNLRLRVATVERGSGLRAPLTVQLDGKRPRAAGRTVTFSRPTRTIRVVLRAADKAGNHTKIVGRVSPAGTLRIIAPKKAAAKTAQRASSQRR